MIGESRSIPCGSSTPKYLYVWNCDLLIVMSKGILIRNCYSLNWNVWNIGNFLAMRGRTNFNAVAQELLCFRTLKEFWWLKITQQNDCRNFYCNSSRLYNYFLCLSVNGSLWKAHVLNKKDIETWIFIFHSHHNI